MLRTKIRYAQPGEADHLKALVRRTIRAYAAMPADEPTVFDGLREGLLIDGVGGISELVLVAEDRDEPGRILGVAAAFPPPGDRLKAAGIGAGEVDYLRATVAKLSAVSVEPEYQQRGVGRRLVLRTIAELRERDYRLVYGAFDADAVHLADFYGGLGFDVAAPGAPLDIGTTSTGTTIALTAATATERYVSQPL